MSTTQTIPSIAIPANIHGNMELMAENAAGAAKLLKALSHEGRLMILCYLAEGEKSVGQIEALLNIRQASVSQLLAKLREEGLVQARRDGKSVFYSLSDPRAAQVIGLLHDMFCPSDL